MKRASTSFSKLEIELLLLLVDKHVGSVEQRASLMKKFENMLAKVSKP